MYFLATSNYNKIWPSTKEIIRILFAWFKLLDLSLLLFNKLSRKPRKAKVFELIKEAVEIEKEFIIKALPCKLIGMNSKLMSQYIEFVADRLSQQLGYGKIFNSINPFDFMESLSMEGKTNFFESRPTQYQSSHVLNQSKNVDSFEVTDEF